MWPVRRATRSRTSRPVARPIHAQQRVVLPLRARLPRLQAVQTRHITSDSSVRPLPSTPMSEPEMVRRLMRSQRVWWWMGSLALGTVALVAFAPELKMGVSRHTADVASRSLQDETLRDNTRELASLIVQTVLNDPNVLAQASQFLQRLAAMESTRTAVQTLVVRTLADPMTRVQVAEVSKWTVAAVLEDPNTLRQVVALFRSTVADAQAKESLLLLMQQLMQDEQTRATVARLLAHTLLQDPVQQNVSKTLGDAVHQVLSRGDIQDHAKEFVSSVVRDQTVQVQSGEAMWSTFMYALTPNWLSWIWANPGEVVGDEVLATPAAEVATVMIAATATEKERAKQKRKEREAQTNDTPERTLELKETS